MIIRETLTMAAAMLVFAGCRNDIEFDACGQIDAEQVTVSAEANGRILSLNVREGDVLEAGQMVGAVDSVQVALQIRELQQRRDGAKSRLIDIARQQKPQMDQLASYENDYRRYSTLLEKNAATQKQVDDIRSQIDVLKSQIAAQKQTWERNNSSVQSEISTYEIQIAEKQDQLSKCRICSPVSGTVLTKYANEGESVTSGKPLFKLANLSETYVRAYFTTSQLGTLKLGDELTVIPDDGSASPKEYKGRVIWISSQAEFTPKDIQTRDERADLVYAVKVALPNDGTLRLGMYVYVRK